MAARLRPGVGRVVLCHDWNEAAAPDASRPRFQLVLERPSG
jgi:hypothetical protein